MGSEDGYGGFVGIGVGFRVMSAVVGIVDIVDRGEGSPVGTGKGLVVGESDGESLGGNVVGARDGSLDGARLGAWLEPWQDA